ncbi:Cyclic nucleotide-gated ion channel [Thalictrum thalictroides]|uniref:Cyclic nucleotide-gated ion channel n=1 Tax=Thalictrum thalictroides TaxID=46969 RepID=A0A7J6WVR3_THATH|nr:Cyclic nucleotide-gated ion channel [Thalictrum thalictroides]
MGMMKRYGFNIEAAGHIRGVSFRQGVQNVGSKGLKSLGRTLKIGAVFPEDLKLMPENKIFDPQDKLLQYANRFFVVICMLAIACDPLFFYLPYIVGKGKCLGLDEELGRIFTTLRSVIDGFYVLSILYIAPSSRVYGRGELVIDPAEIAKRYLQGGLFFVDFLSILPLPQIMDTSNISFDLRAQKNCWRLYRIGFCSTTFIENKCSATISSDDQNDQPLFKFGIYEQAVKSGILSTDIFVSKYFYCLWWGLQNLTTLGQGLQNSMFPGEIIFSISIAVFGLILFALLIGNMQTYLQSLTIRLEEMRVKRRDSEQWMHHRSLPQELRAHVRQYDQYRWVETRGVDEESLVQNLPKDLRRDIKRNLCLALVRRVPLFANMDERVLDAICERLKPSLYTEKTYVVREGDPVDEMLFIIRGRLDSVTTGGGRSGFYNRSLLKEGDFCGEELLTWALDPKAGSNLPSSTRTVLAVSEVEAFALSSEELKFVAGQFRRLHSRQNLSSSSFAATIYASRFATNALRRIRSTRSVDLIKLQKPPEPDFNADDAD